MDSPDTGVEVKGERSNETGRTADLVAIRAGFAALAGAMIAGGALIVYRRYLGQRGENSYSNHNGARSRMPRKNVVVREVPVNELHSSL